MFWFSFQLCFCFAQCSPITLWELLNFSAFKDRSAKHLVCIPLLPLVLMFSVPEHHFYMPFSTEASVLCFMVPYHQYSTIIHSLQSTSLWDQSRETFSIMGHHQHVSSVEAGMLLSVKHVVNDCDKQCNSCHSISLHLCQLLLDKSIKCSTFFILSKFCMATFSNPLQQMHLACIQQDNIPHWLLEHNLLRPSYIFNVLSYYFMLSPKAAVHMGPHWHILCHSNYQVMKLTCSFKD